MFGANGVAHPTSIHPHLAKIEASQRAIAKVVGVDQKTVSRDLNRGSESFDSPDQKKPNETKAPDPLRESNDSPPDSGRAAVTRLAEKYKRPRSGNATHDNDDEWYTPPKIIEAARSAMGGLALAISLIAQTVVGEAYLAHDANRHCSFHLVSICDRLVV